MGISPKMKISQIILLANGLVKATSTHDQTTNRFVREIQNSDYASYEYEYEIDELGNKKKKKKQKGSSPNRETGGSSSGSPGSLLSGIDLQCGSQLKGRSRTIDIGQD